MREAVAEHLEECEEIDNAHARRDLGNERWQRGRATTTWIVVVVVHITELAICSVELLSDEEVRTEIRAPPLACEAREPWPILERIAPVHVGGRVSELCRKPAHAILYVAALLFARIDDNLCVVFVSRAVHKETVIRWKTATTIEYTQEFFHLRGRE
jgi:hypothetical protein